MPSAATSTSSPATRGTTPRPCSSASGTTPGGTTATRPPPVQLGTALQAVLRGHQGKVAGVAYSSDGRRIVSESDDNTVRIWDAHTFVCLEVVQGSRDVAGIAAGESISPFSALGRGLETMVEQAGEGKPVAWFPIALTDIRICPSGRSWAGGAGPQVQIITLAGVPGPSGGG